MSPHPRVTVILAVVIATLVTPGGTGAADRFT
jgi:hypothetical protein